jgi:hypothetical protein
MAQRNNQKKYLSEHGQDRTAVSRQPQLDMDTIDLTALKRRVPRTITVVIECKRLTAELRVRCLVR